LHAPAQTKAPLGNGAFVSKEACRKGVWGLRQQARHPNAEPRLRLMVTDKTRTF